MEQQLTELLELLKNGLAEIPEYGTQMWEVTVQGVRMDGLINIGVLILFIAIVSGFTYSFYKVYTKALEDRDYSRSDLAQGVLVVALGLLAIALIIAMFYIPVGLMNIFAPEYQIINRIIGSL